MPTRKKDRSTRTCESIEEATDRRNNTGYRGITLQKVANSKDGKRHYLTVLATSMVDGKQQRKQFGISRYGLDKALRLAVRQLCRWRHKRVSDRVLDTIDKTKSHKWLMENRPKRRCDTNTGFEAVRIVEKKGYWYVSSTWRDPASKRQRTRYASLRKSSYIEALRIAVAARCLALGRPIKEIKDEDAQKGQAWLDEHI